MPSVFGKEAKKKQLISQLPLLFARIQLEHHIPAGDFPDCARMQGGPLGCAGGCGTSGRVIHGDAEPVLPGPEGFQPQFPALHEDPDPNSLLSIAIFPALYRDISCCPSES
ncbi:hypothetical protein AAES_82209 [Amazona aestiva]|uniref:DUF5600 domain-containing protein n=1 Tax=Amazona aestiva TaxID=12930 RepID=A0A0Q3MFE0_AMAAE|nr:hypothetical protein AAES_82209 [Amazona aestiva]